MKYLALVVLLVVTSVLPASAEHCRNKGSNALKVAAGVFVAGLLVRALQPKQAPAPKPVPLVQYSNLGGIAIEVRNSCSWDAQQLGDEFAGILTNFGFSSAKQQSYDDPTELKRLARTCLYTARITLNQGQGQQSNSSWATNRYSSDRQTELQWAHATVQIFRANALVFSVSQEASDQGGSISSSSSSHCYDSQYSAEAPSREDVAIRNVLVKAAAMTAQQVAQRFGQASNVPSAGYSQAPQYRAPGYQPASTPSYRGKVQQTPQGQTSGPAEYDPTTTPQFSARGNNQISR